MKRSRTAHFFLKTSIKNKLREIVPDTNESKDYEETIDNRTNGIGSYDS